MILLMGLLIIPTHLKLAWGNFILASCLGSVLLLALEAFVTWEKSCQDGELLRICNWWSANFVRLDLIKPGWTFVEHMAWIKIKSFFVFVIACTTPFFYRVSLCFALVMQAAQLCRSPSRLSPLYICVLCSKIDCGFVFWFCGVLRQI